MFYKCKLLQFFASLLAIWFLPGYCVRTVNTSHTLMICVLSHNHEWCTREKLDGPYTQNPRGPNCRAEKRFAHRRSVPAEQQVLITLQLLRMCFYSESTPAARHKPPHYSMLAAVRCTPDTAAHQYRSATASHCTGTDQDPD